MLTGPSVLIAFNNPSNVLLRRGIGIISLDGRGIALDGVGLLEPSPFKVVESFVGTAPPLQFWSNQFPPDTAGTIVFRDRDIGQYLGAVAQAKGLGSFMEQRYAGVLDELRGLPSLRQLSIAVTDFRDGLPDLSLLVWADPDAVDAMVTRIQTRMRVHRDQEVLTNALAANEQPADQPNALFAQYQVMDGHVGPANLTAEDFSNASIRASRWWQHRAPPVASDH